MIGEGESSTSAKQDPLNTTDRNAQTEAYQRSRTDPSENDNTSDIIARDDGSEFPAEQLNPNKKPTMEKLT